MKKCIACGSLDVSILENAETNIVDKVANGVGLILCVPFFLVPGINRSAVYQARECLNEAKKSTSQKCRCNKCGNIWTESKWG